MKILAVSDNVLPQMESAKFLRDSYTDAELIVSCGDMPAPYLEYIVSVLNVPLFYVRGNHDESYNEQPPGGDDLHRRSRYYKGLWFAGLEGSIRYNQGTPQYTETQMLVMVLSYAPRLLLRRIRTGVGVDVLLTHSPPLHIHDQKDNAHRGFRSLRWFMHWYRPRYLLHGHVDTWDRRQTTVTKYEQSEVININPMKVLTINEREVPGGSR